MFKKTLLLGAFAILAISPTASIRAQSTDGNHVIQVFPVVVDTSSYTQRFILTNSTGSATTLQPRYYPGSGTPQETLYGQLACPSISLPARGSISFASLRQICPALQPGSNYGMLHLTGSGMVNFAGFSRVSNAAGNGFSVEAFAASEFTPIVSRVAGLRRLAATATSPAYQTNCFIARMSELAPQSATSNTVEYQLRTPDDSTTIGSVKTVQLSQGTFHRLLDIYDSVGAPPGDYENSILKVTGPISGPPGAGIISFCTVQDNSSFGADFRIGKRYAAGYTTPTGDARESRSILRNGEEYSASIASNKTYVLAPDKLSSNVHILYSRTPDFIDCRLFNTPPGGSGTLYPATGLEMRLLDFYGNVVAGGNDVTSFGRVYLGDASYRTFGMTYPYYLQVETVGESTVERPYTLWCNSGSGIGGMQLIETGGPDRF